MNPHDASFVIFRAGKSRARFAHAPNSETGIEIGQITAPYNADHLRVGNSSNVTLRMVEESLEIIHID